MGIQTLTELQVLAHLASASIAQLAPLMLTPTRALNGNTPKAALRGRAGHFSTVGLQLDKGSTPLLGSQHNIKWIFGFIKLYHCVLEGVFLYGSLNVRPGAGGHQTNLPLARYLVPGPCP